jgi:hypothetical protein
MSHKFAHGSTLKDPDAPLFVYDHFISAEPPPSVVALSLTCHQIYKEVIGGNIFYKYNDFEFEDFEVMMNYLFAITQPWMHSIRRITCRWVVSWPNMQSYGFKALDACRGLQHLCLKIDSLDPEVKKWIGFTSLIKMRGLLTFRLIYVPDKWTADDAVQRRENELCNVYESAIGNEITKPRTTQRPRKLKDVQGRAKLNVLGDGRLGPDVKPGIVSSRTRAQLVKQRSLNHLGVFEDATPPKYDLEHNLIWRVCEVITSREITSYDGTSVELCVKWLESNQVSWESLSHLIEQKALGNIIKFPADLDIVRAQIELDSQNRNFDSLEERRKWISRRATEAKKWQRRNRRATLRFTSSVSK